MKDMNYYNTSGAMYRPQQGVALQGPQLHNSGSGINPPWYSGYHQGLPMASPQANGYCMQEDQMWPHSVFHQDFPADISHHHPGLHHLHHYHHHNQQAHQIVENETQLPSPQTTVSGSDMSSPDAPGGTISPANLQITRPSPAATYDWVNKTAYQNQPTPGKTRTKDKYRVVYTDHQRVELEKEFYYSRYITIRRKSELASVLGLSERQVKIWFQNRRAKERKQVKKQEELTQKDGILMHQQHSLLPPSSVSAIM